MMSDSEGNLVIKEEPFSEDEQLVKEEIVETPPVYWGSGPAVESLVPSGPSEPIEKAPTKTRPYKTRRPKVCTPDMVAKIEQYKRDNPKLTASEIRERLRTEGVPHVPCIGSISTILRKCVGSNNITQKKLELLEAAFAVQPCPGVYEMLDLQKITELSKEKISAWFVNRLTQQSSSRPFIIMSRHTEEQVNFLEAAYKLEPYPCLYERMELQRKTQLPEKRIMQWFLSRRARKPYHRGEPSHKMYTEERLKILSAAFELNTNPDIFERMELEKQLNIPQQKIKTWFKDRRRRGPRKQFWMKRKSGMSDANIANSIKQECLSSEE